MIWIIGAALALAAAVWLLRRNVIVVTVDGPSMQPSYRDGALVLAWRVRGRRLRRGQVVMLAPEHEGPPAGRPGRLWLMKRVAALPGDPVPFLSGAVTPPGSIAVLGDNPEHSYDSRQEGFITLERVRAIVLFTVG